MPNTFTDAGNLRAHLVNIEGLNVAKPLNKRRKNTKEVVFYKAKRGETEVWIHSRVYEFIVTNSIFSQIT
ncbi:hypothetical protein G6F37_003126 [Rhizopus arrhizus]|nr:hypothetical protein G6F38_007396 [Rhizopus arrhizus]KAG1161388.1 hypothetical protein G6F37_003126 [Rhizopus arrhizus]